MPARALTKDARKKLKRLAHNLTPRVQVGKNGVTDTVVEAVREALDAHELIKIKFIGNKDQKKELTAQIEEETESALVAIIGHVAILYRQQEDKEKRKIKLH